MNPNDKVLVPREPTAEMLEDGDREIAFGNDAGDVYRAMLATAPQPSEATLEPCERCNGNGELVTDWERYEHPRPSDVGDEAVEECPDCDGNGEIEVAPNPPLEQRARDEYIETLRGMIESRCYTMEGNAALQAGIDALSQPQIAAPVAQPAEDGLPEEKPGADITVYENECSERAMNKFYAQGWNDCRIAYAQQRSAAVVVDEANFRKEFERWLSNRHGYSTERWADSGEYHSHNTRSYWQAWNVALTAALSREEG